MKKEERRMKKPRRTRVGAMFLPSAFEMNPLQCILILLVRVYRVTLSPAKTFLLGPAGQCRFEPSCSQYAIEALKTHGVLSGSWLAARRVCRCHPWGKCGEDPVPPKVSKVQSPRSKVTPPEFKVPCSEVRI